MARGNRPYGLDADRGFTKRTHPQGFQVAEYADAPGEYFNVYGDPVSLEIARDAGFDVEGSTKTALRRKLMAQARERIESELHEQLEKEMAEHDASLEKEHAHLVGQEPELQHRPEPLTYLPYAGFVPADPGDIMGMAPEEHETVDVKQPVAESEGEKTSPKKGKKGKGFSLDEVEES